MYVHSTDLAFASEVQNTLPKQAKAQCPCSVASSGEPFVPLSPLHIVFGAHGALNNKILWLGGKCAPADFAAAHLAAR